MNSFFTYQVIFDCQQLPNLNYMVVSDSEENGLNKIKDYCNKLHINYSIITCIKKDNINKVIKM
jgi:predicted small metal-binding protein